MISTSSFLSLRASQIVFYQNPNSPHSTVCSPVVNCLCVGGGPMTDCQAELFSSYSPACFFIILQISNHQKTLIGYNQDFFYFRLQICRKPDPEGCHGEPVQNNEGKFYLMITLIIISKGMGSSEASHITSQQIKQIYSIYSRNLINQKKLKPDTKRVSKDVLTQLFQSFTRYTQYQWSTEITPLFISYFSDNIGSLWTHDKEIFYRQMLENSGLIEKVNKKIKGYENQFYSCEAIKLKQQDERIVEEDILALNSSIMDEAEIVPFVIKKKRKQPRPRKGPMAQSMMEKVERDFQMQVLPQFNTHTSEYYDTQILRSSVIVPQTVFVQRLNEQSKFKVNNMLNFYKVFSESLQQMARNLTLIACPLKHFEIYLKRRIRIKKIKSSESTASLLRNSRAAALERKKKQYNNTYLLTEIRDFTEAYTQFVWKYLNLYRIAETEFSAFISIETAYGVVLKLVWSFASWIGERGFEWEERQIPHALQKMTEQQRKINESNIKKKGPKIELEVDSHTIILGCELSSETNPQKYLKKIVIIYRELSRKCSNADELILYYEILFQQIAKKNCHRRLFKMQCIIDKLLRMEDSSGQICYAWTTWNIMVGTIKNIITNDSYEKQVEEDFRQYLSNAEKQRLSG